MRALLAFLGILVGLALCEAGVRLLFPSHGDLFAVGTLVESERGKFTRYDKRLGWVGIENVEDDFHWLDTEHPVRQNRFGFRGREHERKRSENRRVAFLGDSFVWGFGVPESEIFTSMIEQRSARPVEAVNFGVSGYATDQELLFWEAQGAAWKPDELVLLVSVFNDPREISHPEMYGYPKPLFRLDAGALVLTNVPVPRRGGAPEGARKAPGGEPRLLARALAASSVLSVIGKALLGNEEVRRWMESEGLVVKRSLGYAVELPLYLSESTDPRVEGPWELLFALIEVLHKSAIKNGATLTIVAVPSITQVYPELWEDYVSALDLVPGTPVDPLAPGRRIRNFGEEHGIRTVDLLPALREAGRDDPYLYFPKNLHWTREGHSVVADVLIEELDL